MLLYIWAHASSEQVISLTNAQSISSGTNVYFLSNVMITDSIFRLFVSMICRALHNDVVILSYLYNLAWGVDALDDIVWGIKIRGGMLYDLVSCVML